jgi:hypothetical protein
MKYAEKKSKLLGENYSTACHKLRKIIMFDLVQRANCNICYRCLDKIKTAKELSIEHKEQWSRAENPSESFYDLNNIAFSHLKCNAKHGRDSVINYAGVRNLPKIPLNRKLSEDQIRKIRELKNSGETLRDIAIKFDIHHQTVWQIVHYKTYKDVE